MQGIDSGRPPIRLDHRGEKCVDIPQMQAGQQARAGGELPGVIDRLQLPCQRPRFRAIPARIIYGRGAWRPFFIGGTITGFGPHLGAVYYTGMVAVQLLDGSGWAELFAGDRLTNLMIAAVFAFPGVFSLLGGLVGVWTWWMLEPAKRAVGGL